MGVNQMSNPRGGTGRRRILLSRSFPPGLALVLPRHWVREGTPGAFAVQAAKWAQISWKGTVQSGSAFELSWGRKKSEGELRGARRFTSNPGR